MDFISFARHHLLPWQPSASGAGSPHVTIHQASAANGSLLWVAVDSMTGEIQELRALDRARGVAYCWSSTTPPDTDEPLPKAAAPELEWVRLDVWDDIHEKASAIAHGQPYDPRVILRLTLARDEWYMLMKLAHENDLTLNQLIEQVLRRTVEASPHEMAKAE